MHGVLVYCIPTQNLNKKIGVHFATSTLLHGCCLYQNNLPHPIILKDEKSVSNVYINAYGHGLKCKKMRVQKQVKRQNMVQDKHLGILYREIYQDHLIVRRKSRI